MILYRRSRRLPRGLTPGWIHLNVGVELVVIITRLCEPAVTKSAESAVSRVSIVVAPVDNLRDSSWLIEIVQRLRSLAGQSFREVDVGAPSDEVMAEFKGTSIQWDDSFAATVVSSKITAVSRGEDLNFEATEHDAMQYETCISRSFG
ncbi:MAG: hypothetical protein J07HQW1_00659 [Haloquadratum walsbyi J07HQW1]|uniref:Uncharacterized protein n=1 Tax=Haloquadratum walsbyi J07HQW1 TaxID=1238424 RepID=U1N2A8_9EURY|nr:MAG: hypothetical protein J07HQW1_00659 [Haloquadratum walsbyi J07HQW1]